MESPNFINNPQNSQDKIFSLLFNEDELTWQTIIYDLVRQEGMDPWDIDISQISAKFLEMLKKLKEMDFRISGKVVLAAALLLKIKSNRLVDEDINALDSLMSSVDDPESLLDDLSLEDGTGSQKYERGNNPRLMPKTPQPRKRKVSLQDLIQALEKALEVEVRRPAIYVPPKVQLTAPLKVHDITELISEVYVKVQTHYSNPTADGKKLTFSQLVPTNTKEEKVFTFIPLLQLENQRKVDMNQEVHFGEIGIALAKPMSSLPAVDVEVAQGSRQEENEVEVKQQKQKVSVSEKQELHRQEKVKTKKPREQKENITAKEKKPQEKDAKQTPVTSKEGVKQENN